MGVGDAASSLTAAATTAGVGETHQANDLLERFIGEDHLVEVRRL